MVSVRSKQFHLDFSKILDSQTLSLHEFFTSKPKQTFTELHVTSPFVHTSEFEKSVVITDSNFTASTHSTIWILVSFEDRFSNENVNRITINSSTFLGQFQILRIESTPDCEISMNNVNVTYSQHVDAYRVEATVWDQDSVMTIHSENAMLAMKDVIITTETACHVDRIMSFDWYWIPKLPYCDPPHPFLFNQVCDMTE